MPSGAGIAFTLLSLLLAVLLWRSRAGREPLSPAWLRLRSAIPPLLLVACIPSGCVNERFDTLRLYAQGMAVTQLSMQGGRAQPVPTPGCEAYFGAGQNPVFVVGPARGCVDLVVQEPAGADLNGALVRLDHQAGGDATIRLATLTGSGGTLIAAQDGEEGRTYAGAVPLNEGDTICLNRCATPQARWWTFRDDGSLEPAGGGEARELRTRAGLFGSIQPYGPANRIHRLGTILCDQPDSSGNCANPLLADPARPGEVPRPAQSFLFQKGGFGGHQWFAMMLDPGARVRHADGSAVDPSLVQAVPLPENSSRHVAILAVRGNTLRELRSFTLGHQLIEDPTARRRFTLALDTPELIPIGHCARPLSRLAVAPDQASPEAFAITAFGNRPGSVISSAAAGMPIDQFNLCRGTSFDFRAPLDGSATAGPIQRQIDFRVDRMGIPWLLVILAFAVALVVHTSGEAYWSVHRLDGQILVLTQYLLVVRTLVGIDGVFADPAIDWRTIYGDVGTAMVAIPAILISIRRRADLTLTTAAALAAFVAVALASLWWWLGPPDLIGQLFALLALGALGLRIAVAFTADRPARPKPAPTPAPTTAPEPAKEAYLERLPSEVEAERERVEVAVPAPTPEPEPESASEPTEQVSPSAERPFLARLVLDRSPDFWLYLLGTIVAVRILLGLLGYRERIFGIALSAVYVPLLLACVGALLAQAEAAPPERRRRFGLIFLAALGVGVGVVALAINDIGFALVHLPPIAGVALWRMRRWRRHERATPPSWKDKLPWTLPAAGLVAGYLLLWGMIALTPPPSAEAPLEERVAYAVEDRSTDPNWLRLRAVFAPSQIAEIGNRAAAIQLDQSLLLGELTGTLLGRGWLYPVDLGSFRFQATHLSDYLSASHIMAPFGRLGAIAFLLVLAAAAGAAVYHRVPAPAPWPQLAGALAIWTLFGAAAYMILANLLLVPFTGRNIYLLAASSGGDLIEGLALLLMARIGIAYRRAG
ncbi:MAG: hypothetical protein ACK4SZ_10320 [Allosphingosinicella sp.]|uniref:hypothetical protein n=1 Tax=Allosphingosinicella sp. TaxID=2823234 RepID=UPI003962E098